VDKNTLVAFAVAGPSLQSRKSNHRARQVYEPLLRRHLAESCKNKERKTLKRRWLLLEAVSPAFSAKT
jgi:predicted kinase